MQLSGCLVRLRKRMDWMWQADGVLYISTDEGLCAPAELGDISEYGCTFQLAEAGGFAVQPGSWVRIGFRDYREGIGGTVISVGSKGGFYAVRFEQMEDAQFVQLLTFIQEREETYAFRRYRNGAASPAKARTM